MSRVAQGRRHVRRLARWLLSASLILAPVTGLPATAAEDAELARAIAAAASLLDAGQPRAALAELKPFEIRGASRPAFNEVAGLAYFEIGQYSEAVYALRRLVAQQPKNAGARMDLARAYFALGDLASAEEEFLALRKLNPPPRTADRIEQYLLAIRRRGISEDTTTRGHLGAGAGYDSNANAATDIRSFGGFDLDDNSRGQGSAFGEIVLGGSAMARVAPRWRFIGTAGAQMREYPDAEFVNREQLTGSVVARYNAGPRIVLFGVDGAVMNIDGEYNSRNGGLGVTGSLPLVGRWAGVFQLRYGALRHSRELAVRDVDSLLGLVGLRRPLQIGRSGVLALDLLAGRDDAARSDGLYARDLYGAAVRLNLILTPSLLLTPGLSVLDSHYDKPFLDRSRDDLYLRLGIDGQWSLDTRARWQLRPSLAFVDNDSSVALFGYDRLTLGLQLRRNFE